MGKSPKSIEKQFKLSSNLVQNNLNFYSKFLYFKNLIGKTKI